MRVCRDCGESKPVEDYNRCSSNKDGLHVYCKPCHRARAKAWQQGPGKASHAQAANRWRNGKGRESTRAKEQERLARDPRKVRARTAVRDALVKGTLSRPVACSACAKACKPHAHHHRGYDPANWLAVVWLCPKCHNDAHDLLRAQEEAA